jgi:hypothetical protein
VARPDKVAMLVGASCEVAETAALEEKSVADWL